MVYVNLTLVIPIISDTESVMLNDSAAEFQPESRGAKRDSAIPTSQKDSRTPFFPSLEILYQLV